MDISSQSRLHKPHTSVPMNMLLLCVQAAELTFRPEMTWDEAFVVYEKLYNKQYGEEDAEAARANFRLNYADLQHSINALRCDYCGLTPHLDQNFTSLFNAKILKPFQSEKLQTLQNDQLGPKENITCWENLCQSYSCGINTTIPKGTSYFNRIDLREARMLTRPKD